MSINWTSEQRAAIHDRGGALLVSAAAGSGKTAVLTERVVSLIADEAHPVEADRLLIVTFTNAAAAELRARIGEALLERSRQQPENLRLRRQRMLLQRAPICTIDAFCLNLLHRYFAALDIPPDFSMGDDGSIGQLRTQALGQTLEQAYQDKDFCAFADLYGKGRSDKAAGEAILTVYNFLRSLPDYRKKLDEYLAPWQQPDSFARSSWHDLLLAEACREAEAAARLFRSAIQNARLDAEDAELAAAEKKKTPAAKEKAAFDARNKYAKLLDALETSAETCEELAKLAGAKQWEPLFARLTAIRMGEQPYPGMKGTGTFKGERKELFKTQSEAAVGLFEKICAHISADFAEIELDRQAAAPRIAALFEAVRDFDTRFTAAKLENKLLEFSDFEHLALRLLRDETGSRTPLCEVISAQYDAVMVDEYQDTNALQDALYDCLARPDGSNRFLVGDLKQSIYRFRQAEPGIFRQKLDSWELLPSAAARPQTEAPRRALLALDSNFRSAPQVVNGINYFFEQLMSPELGDTEYGDGQRLVCGAPGEFSGAVEVRLLEGGTPERDADWIAQRIACLIEEKALVRSKEGLRPVTAGDFCILLSTRKNFLVYAEALRSRNIPVYQDSSEDLLDAPHIRPLVALLQVIDNPAQDIYLAAAMLGPLFGFAEDDLVRLRAQERRMSLYGTILNRLEAGEDTPENRRLRSFCERLAELRRLSRSLPVERLLEEIFVSTGYLAALGTMENGARRREDARRFAAFCAQHGAGGISGLIRAIEAAEEAGGYKDTAPGAARPGCVTIMTIHRSKGLEFPVVILADTGHKFNASELRENLAIHREQGIGLRLRPEDGSGLYKTVPYEAVSSLCRQEALSERMRLLYVALTRAKDRLIVTIPLPEKEPEKELKQQAACLAAGAGQSRYRQADCFADWLTAAMLLHPRGGVLRELAGQRDLLFVDTPSEMLVSYERLPEGEADEECAAPTAAPAPDTELTRRLVEGFGWQYPAAALSTIPAKVAVTGVVHRAERTGLERPGFLSKDGLTAAELGTALHAFLEHADFAALAVARREGNLPEAIRAERERQLSLRLTSEEISVRLDEKKLLRFFSGEIFARIAGAERVYREYDFITALPASVLPRAEDAPLPEAAAQEAKVLVQGIADLILEYPDHLELIDYKTDRSKDAAGLIAAYRPQLALYAVAIRRRFAQKPITYQAIYSFALDSLVELPPEEA